VARHLGTSHHEDACADREVLDGVDDLPRIYDEPFADSSAVPMHLVSRAARRSVTVALSGDGGDELFFGYPRYAYFADYAWALGLPRPIRRTAALLASRLPTRRLRRVADVLRSDDPDEYARFIGWMPLGRIAELTGQRPVESPGYAAMLARLGNTPREDRAPLIDLVTYLPDDILTKVDRASMAAGLEVRSPLLDHRVVEFVLGLPAHLKRRHATTKWLLRRLLYRRVPARLFDRPKMGFGVPLADWFRGPLRERMNDYCAGPGLEALGLDPAAARLLWKRFLAGGSVRPDLLWQILVLLAWDRKYRSAPMPAASVR
jgi:asparagine synthase (glutamine-hydrolysing)